MQRRSDISCDPSGLKWSAGDKEKPGASCRGDAGYGFHVIGGRNYRSRVSTFCWL